VLQKAKRARGLSARARSGEADAWHGTVNAHTIVRTILSGTKATWSLLHPSSGLAAALASGLSVDFHEGLAGAGNDTRVLAMETRKAKPAVKSNAIERPEHAIAEFCDIRPTKAEASLA
jgi:hypothetical protein